MTTAIKRRRGTTAQHSTFTGLEGEVTVDTTKDTVVVHDGSTAGGFPLAKEGLQNTNTTNLSPIVGTDTASDDTFLIYDTSASAMKKITRAELNNAIEVDALANVTITGGTINGATIGATTATTGKFTTLEATGVATVSAGAVGTPAITTTGDTNTGIFFPTADTIAFTEGGVESMRITSAGDVGIGTSSPSYKLDVLTNTNATAGARIQNLNSGGAAFTTLWLDNDSAGIKSGLVKNSSTNGGNFPANSFYTYYNDTGSSGFYNASASPIVFVTSGAERMRITSAGDVGIGTSSPNAKLQVAGVVAVNGALLAADFALNIQGSSGVNGGLVAFNSGATVSTMCVSEASQGTIGTRTNHPLVCITNNTERMRITSAGNVGIATTTPFTLLDVTGPIGIALGNTGEATGIGSIRITNGATGVSSDGGLEFKIAGDSNGYGSKIQALNSGGSQLVFANRFGSATWIERMRIDSSGNVGIGTSSLTAKLEVKFDTTVSASNGAIGIENAGAGEQGITFTKKGYSFNGPAAAITYNGSALGVSSASYLSFRTNSGVESFPSERMRIDSSGNLLVGITSARANAGDVQVSKGISFPATQSAQSDANTLDDYEEGTWTPTVFGGTTAGTTTYTSQNGFYTKIGRQVTVVIRVQYSALTGTGLYIIGSLPFTSTTSANCESVGTVMVQSLNWNGGTYLNSYMVQNSTQLNIYGNNDDGGLSAQTCANEAVDLWITHTYFTA